MHIGVDVEDIADLQELWSPHQYWYQELLLRLLYTGGEVVIIITAIVAGHATIIGAEATAEVGDK